MAHRGVGGSSGRKRLNILTPQNKATASLWFLQQAYFGLRFGLRLGPPASATPHPTDTVHEPDVRLAVDNRQVDGFGYAGDEADYVSTRF